MSIFTDKKFEQLDYLSQITETIDCPLNTAIAKVPDLVEVDMNLFLERILRDEAGWYFGSYYQIEDFISPWIDFTQFSYHEKKKIKECFNIVEEEQIVLDFSKKTLIGKLKIVKVTSQLDDEALQLMMGYNGISHFSFIDVTSKEIPRLNEIVSLLGINNPKLEKSKSAKLKKSAIISKLSSIFCSNEWRIRDYTLADKVGVWISEYVQEGKLSGLTNLCKLKVMTHSNMPIYSMEEEV